MVVTAWSFFPFQHPLRSVKLFTSLPLHFCCPYIIFCKCAKVWAWKLFWWAKATHNHRVTTCPRIQKFAVLFAFLHLWKTLPDAIPSTSTLAEVSPARLRGVQVPVDWWSNTVRYCTPCCGDQHKKRLSGRFESAPIKTTNHILVEVIIQRPKAYLSWISNPWLRIHFCEALAYRNAKRGCNTCFGLVQFQLCMVPSFQLSTILLLSLVYIFKVLKMLQEWRHSTIKIMNHSWMAGKLKPSVSVL